ERRSMLTSRGANVALDPDRIDLDGFELLYVTGHPLMQAPDGGAGWSRCIARARSSGLRVVAAAGSAGFIADYGPRRLLQALEGVDTLFVSVAEGRLLAGAADPHECARALPFDTVVVTAGRAGAIVAHAGEVHDIPAIPAEVV